MAKSRENPSGEAEQSLALPLERLLSHSTFPNSVAVNLKSACSTFVIRLGHGGRPLTIRFPFFAFPRLCQSPART